MDGFADIRHLAFAALLLLFVVIAVAVGAGAVLVVVDRIRGVRGLRARRAARVAPRRPRVPVPLMGPIVGPLSTFHALSVLRRPPASTTNVARPGADDRLNPSRG